MRALLRFLDFDRPLGLTIVAVVLFGSHVTVNTALAGSACVSLPRAQDEVWLISCRGIGCGQPAQQVERLHYWHYDREAGWQKAGLDGLLATDDPRVTTVVFLHGNRLDFDEAFARGWSAYRAVVSCADERPVRFIVWSWPSEPLRGLVNDARTKAARTDPCGYCLAWLLDRMNPEVPVSCWAHSFGARIVTGALHLLGGGQLNGHRLAARAHERRDPMQVVLVAAALDSDWLLPGHHQDRAMSQVASLLLVNNGCDALLKRYHVIYCRRSCQQALGFTGLATGYLSGDDQGKVSQLDASCQLGRRHWFSGYLDSPHLMARMRGHLLIDNVATRDTSAVTQAEINTQVELALD
jgi:hypothetical protein